MSNNVHSDNRENTEAFESMISGLGSRTHIKIHTIYNITVPPQWQIDLRRNHDQHLIYVKGGQGWYQIEGEYIPLEAGRLIYVSNGCLHSSGADPHQLPRIIPIRFGVYDNETMEQLQLFEKPYYMTLKDYQGIAFVEKFCAIYNYYHQIERIGNEQICHALLTQVIIEFYHHMKGNMAKNRQGVAIKNYLDKHIHHQLKLETIARHFELSTKHLSRIFKSQYGITPKQYLISRIVQQANYYMDDTSLTISQIAQKLGYPDVYTFSKQYKKVVGYSPVNRRREIR